MIEEKIKNTRDVRLRGLEKRKERKEYLQRDGFTKETIHVKYEWKLPRCDIYRIFGHVHDHCPIKVVSPHIVTTSSVVAPTVVKSNDGFQMVGKKRRGKVRLKVPVRRIRTDNGAEFVNQTLHDYYEEVRLKVPVRRIRTDNGAEFVNQTLHDYYEEVSISHETSVARSPQQNGVVERINHTLIEAALTMLIYAQAPLFLWAEAVATAYFTLNRSIIRLRHGKTPYELLHSKLPDLSFFHVFGALCYLTNDSENLAMASEHRSSVPALNEITPGTISSGLVRTSSPSKSYVPPSRNDWDLLFQPMFDELLNPPPSVVNQAPEVITLIAEVIPPVYADSTGSTSSTMVDQDAPSPIYADSTSSTSSTMVDQDAPSPSKSHITTEIQSSVIPQDVGDDNLDMEVAHMGNDPLFGVPILEVTSAQSSSTASPQSNVPVSTQLQLNEQALFCYYNAFLTSVEPKMYKEALTQSCWNEAMQEELNEFERLEPRWDYDPVKLLCCFEFIVSP
nr:hypothetical protein [Tanacetum cinerariifolium]